MNFLLKDYVLKRLEYYFLGLLTVLAISLGIINFNNSDTLLYELYYLWLVIFSYSMYGIFFSIKDVKNKKSFTLLSLMSLLILIFILPPDNVDIEYINLVILIYNIVFFIFLNVITDISNKILTVFGINLILLSNCFSVSINNYKLYAYLMYIISLIYIVCVVYKYKDNILKIHNIHNIFFILGCILEIVIYLSINSLLVICGYSISDNLFLFLNLFQPIFYWLGINIAIINEKVLYVK